MGLIKQSLLSYLGGVMLCVLMLALLNDLQGFALLDEIVRGL